MMKNKARGSNVSIRRSTVLTQKRMATLDFVKF